jgi:Protein of unknown function (DUF1579)
MSHKLYGISASLLALVLFASTAHADDKPKPAAADQPAMDAYMKATQPGPEHEWLKSMAGDFDADVKLFNPDGSQQSTSKGSMHGEMILGGRYLKLSYSGEMDTGTQKIPFKGSGLVGYDNGKKKYQSVWVDELSTGMMITEGTCTGNTATMEGSATDPMSGNQMKVKEISTIVDKDHHKYEMWMSGEDGKMFKVLEIAYTRKS